MPPPIHLSKNFPEYLQTGFVKIQPEIVKRYDTYRPDAEPDIDRLVAGEENAWIVKDFCESPYQRKKIIITDGLLAIEKSYAALKKLISLLDDGFEVYCWCQQGLQRIRSENDFKNAIELIEIPEDIDFVIAALDDDMDDYVFLYNFPPTREFNLAKASESQSCLDLQWQHIHSLASKELAIYPQEICVYSREQLDWVLINIAQIKYIKAIRLANIKCSAEEVLTILKNFSSVYLDQTQLITYMHETEARTNSNELIMLLRNILLPKLNNISFNGFKIKSELLGAVLQAASNVEKLQLKKCENITEALDIKPNSLSRLKEIDVSSSGITSESLGVLLKAAPDVKIIDLSECKNVTGTLDVKSNSLKQLVTIYLSESGITSESLGILLKAAPNVKTIYLNRHEKIAETLDIKSNSLQQLHTICLSKSSITSKSLRILLQAAPNVETLDLTICNNFNELSGIKQNSLLQLKTIHLYTSDITSESLRILLQAAPNVETLNLDGCENINETLDVKPNSLSQLKKIDLSSSGITSESLRILLQAAPNVKMIYLGSCKKLNNALKPTSNSLPALKTIYLSESSITSESLSLFLQAAPHVETIYLNKCKKNTGILDVKPNSLSQLKKIDLSNSSITSESLGILFQAAPNVKTLNLSGCININEALQLKSNSLSRLKTINLSSSSITSESLRILFQAAPNVKTLNLSGCVNINEALQLKSNSLLRLKTINLSASGITSESLRILFQAAPYVEMIYLSACKNINEVLDIESNLLSQLKIIDLMFSNVTSVSLRMLLQAAPHVEMIYLNACKNINKRLDIKPNSLSQLKTIDLSASSITSESLRMLLQAAPICENLDLSDCQNIDDFLKMYSDLLPKGTKLNGRHKRYEQNAMALNVAHCAPHTLERTFLEKSRKNTKVDTDTGMQSDEAFIARKIFYSEIHPENYRIKVHNSLQEDNACHQLITELRLDKALPEDDNNLSQTIEARLAIAADNKWYPLPSLTANDRITTLKLARRYELAYDYNLQQYFIKIESGNEQLATVSYQLKTKSNLNSAHLKQERDNSYNIQSVINQLIKSKGVISPWWQGLSDTKKLNYLLSYCREFTHEKLDDDSLNFAMSGLDKICLLFCYP